MVRDAPLPLITNWPDGKVGGSVDQAYACPANSPGALRAYADQSLSGNGAGYFRVTLRNQHQIVSHQGADVEPLFVELAHRDRLGIDIEQLSSVFTVWSFAITMRARLICVIFPGRTNFDLLNGQNRRSGRRQRLCHVDRPGE